MENVPLTALSAINTIGQVGIRNNKKNTLTLSLKLFYPFFYPMARHVSGKLLALGVADIDGQLVKGVKPSLPLTGQHRGTSMP